MLWRTPVLCIISSESSAAVLTSSDGFQLKAHAKACSANIFDATLDLEPQFVPCWVNHSTSTSRTSGGNGDDDVDGCADMPSFTRSRNTKTR